MLFKKNTLLNWILVANFCRIWFYSQQGYINQIKLFLWYFSKTIFFDVLMSRLQRSLLESDHVWRESHRKIVSSFITLCTYVTHSENIKSLTSVFARKFFLFDFFPFKTMVYSRDNEFVFSMLTFICVNHSNVILITAFYHAFCMNLWAQYPQVLLD